MHPIAGLRLQERRRQAALLEAERERRVTNALSRREPAAAFVRRPSRHDIVAAWLPPEPAISRSWRNLTSGFRREARRVRGRSAAPFTADGPRQ
jgi:hypothetical protein